MMPVIILVETQLPENLGAVARVMANFGMTELRLVRPQFDSVHPKAMATAVGAVNLIHQAKVTQTFEDAITDINYLFGTSSSQRDIIKAYETPKTFSEFLGSLNQEEGGIGIVFGPERTGLTNDYIARCQRMIQVPVNPAFSSLNLAQAVAIISYEIYQQKTLAFNKQSYHLHMGQTQKASQQEIRKFLNFLEQSLDQTHYWRVDSKKPIMWRNLQNIFTRMDMTAQDIKTLYGMIRSLNRSSP